MHTNFITRSIHWVLRTSVGVATLLAASASHAGLAADWATRQVEQTRLFHESLVWVGEAVPPEEQSAELWAAVRGAGINPWPQRLEALERFVAAHSDSAWTPSIRLQLGAHYRLVGRDSRALEHWQAGWLATQAYSAGTGKALADRLLGRLVELLVNYGRQSDLDAVLEAVRDRKLSDLTQQLGLTQARERLTMMKNLSGRVFRCGTFALQQVAFEMGQRNVGELMEFPSPRGGFSLFTLNGLARELKLEMVAVRRPPGDQHLVTPCVMHLALNHYIALLRPLGERIQVLDPAGGAAVPRSAEVLNAEASGYFLVPADRCPPGWELLTFDQASAVTGAGPCTGIGSVTPPCEETCPSSCPPGGATSTTGPYIAPLTPGTSGPGCSGCKTSFAGTPTPAPGAETLSAGMPEWEVTDPYVSIWLRDKPMTYRTSQGEEIALKLVYHQHEARSRVPATNIWSFGTNWNCNWLSYLQVTNWDSWDDSWPQFVGCLNGPGGGAVQYSFFGTLHPSYRTRTTLERVLVNNVLVAFKEVFPSGAETYYELLRSIPGDYTVVQAFPTRRVDP